MLNPNSFARAIVLPAISVTLLISCSSKEKPVTKAEALQFAYNIEKWVKGDSVERLNNIFYEHVFIKRVANEAGDSLDKNFPDGVKEGFSNIDYGNQIIHALGKNGFYLLVKQYEKDQKQHLIFRLYGDSKVNYHDYELIKQGNEVKVADIFIYLSGENLSASVAHALLMMNANFNNLSKREKDKIKNFKTIKTLISQKKYVEAKERFEEFPPAIKNIKLFQLVNIQICSELGDSMYLASLNEYQKLYPHDPNMYLLMVDAYCLQNDYSDALKSVNQLDSLIDKDPFQDYYRGLLYRKLGDTANYRKCLEHVNVYMPSFSDGVLQLLYCYVNAGAMDKAAALIKKYDGTDELNKEDLDNIFLLYPQLKKR